MAKTDKNTTATTAPADALSKNESRAGLVKTTEDLEFKASESSADDLVSIVCSLQNGIKFTQLNSAPNGYSIPGVNSNKRGSDGQVLALPGGAILVKVPKLIWEEIKKVYGSMDIFTAIPPFLRELKSDKDFGAKSLQDELKEVRTGFEATDPNASPAQLPV